MFLVVENMQALVEGIINNFREITILFVYSFLKLCPEWFFKM